MMHRHRTAIVQASEGSFLRLYVMLDAGSAAVNTWYHPAMQREDAPEVVDILITDRPGDLLLKMVPG